MSKKASNHRNLAMATAAELAAVDALVSMLEDCRKGRAAFDAMEVQALAALNAVADQQRERLPSRRAVRELPLREIAAEAALAVRASDRVMQGLISDAAQTVAMFPRAVTALSEGRIARGHLTTLVDAGAAIDDEALRAAFEADALEVAERESVGRFRSVVRAMSERANPRSMAERHLLAREDRSVRVRDLHDGMSEVVSVQPSVIAHGIHDRLTQQAKLLQDHARAEAAATSGLPSEPDERTLAQLRADLFADLLLAGAPATDPTAAADGPGMLGAVRALIQVTVPVLTLAGVDADVVELDGRVPIDPETAQELAGNAPGWDRVLTHPITGAVLAVDRYTPNADLRRRGRAVDRRCRTPGCRVPAHRCDLDHNHAAAEGGLTEACNLCHFCRRHHVLKHLPGWRVRQLPGGRIEWTTPTGRLYIDHPPPRGEYLPVPAPPRRSPPHELDVVERGRPHGPRRRLLPRRSDDVGEGSGPTRPSRVRFVADGDDPPF